MEVTHQLIDIAAYQRQMPNPRPGVLEDMPHDIVEKAPGDLWIVAHQPVTPERQVAWFHHGKGQHVLVPLFPYVLAPTPEMALGYMLQMGITAANQLGGRKVKRLHLSLGRPVNQFMGDPQLGDGWQFWAGIGLVLQ